MKSPRVVGERGQHEDAKDRRPATTLDKIVEKDREKLRTNSRHTHFTAEYTAWLKRQAKKGRNHGT